MKRLLALAAMLTLTACTDRQVTQWVEWFERDPEPALEYAQHPDVQAQLAQREAVPARATGTSSTSTGWTVDWDAIAACESGGNWAHPPVTNSTGTYSGGLMWSQRYWPTYGGDFAPWAYQATKAEQIAAAERLVDGSYAEADRAWDCL